MKPTPTGRASVKLAPTERAGMKPTPTGLRSLCENSFCFSEYSERLVYLGARNATRFVFLLQGR